MDLDKLFAEILDIIDAEKNIPPSFRLKLLLKIDSIITALTPEFKPVTFGTPPTKKWNPRLN